MNTGWWPDLGGWDSRHPQVQDTRSREPWAASRVLAAACHWYLVGIDIRIGMHVRKPPPAHVVVVRRRQGRDRWASDRSEPRRAFGTDRRLGAVVGRSGLCGRAPAQDDAAAQEAEREGGIRKSN